MRNRVCPGCGGKISPNATLCRECRKRAIVAGVNLLAPGARSQAPPPPSGPRTSGQNRAYHGKCATLAALRQEPAQKVKQWALEQASRQLRRPLGSSKDMSEDEMSDLLDLLDAAIAGEAS